MEFLQDIDYFEVIEITSSIINIAITCLEKGTIRTLDALHISCAVFSMCNLFLTSDKRQCIIAEKMKLKVKLI
ncbi:MAG: type II toxin-antitoxin system VapC family toxin [Spirochaetales bacterium]|nr:type II toxin-antitoxin system VapC family toxin [Spirochaetales bacterium]